MMGLVIRKVIYKLYFSGCSEIMHMVTCPYLVNKCDAHIFC